MIIKRNYDTHNKIWIVEAIDNNKIVERLKSASAVGYVLDEYKLKTKYAKRLAENAPTNCVGSGAVAGIGVGSRGEPGVKKNKKKLTPFVKYISRKRAT